MRVIIFLTIVFTLNTSCSTDSTDKPNIIVFLVDDMGLMDTSVPFITDGESNAVRQNLNNWYRTPGMERLAERGVRFSNFYSHTVCSPTRISIMTGQNSTRHNTTNWINPTQNNRGDYGPSVWGWEGLKSSDVTLPALLRNIGYTTIHIGKAHFGPQNSEGSEPLNLGFDVNIAGHAWGHPGSYYGTDNFGNIFEGRRGMSGVPDLGKYHGEDIYLTEALTIEAKNEISEAVNQNKPFYLYMSHYAVHTPFQADERFISNYEYSEKSEDAKAFATMIEGMDKSLGDIMDHIKELNIAENTLILFLGDNGSDAPLGNNNNIGSSAPLRGKKGSKWEGGTRVPFIAAWCEESKGNKWQKKLKIKPGEIQEQFGTCYDIFPTITDLLGIRTPENHIVDGENLNKIFSGKTDKTRSDIFLSHFPHWHRSNMFTTIRKDNWKLIYHYFPEAENVESHYLLFNLKEDPSESDDLSTEFPEKVKELMELMVRELETKDAKFPERDGEIVRPVIP